MARAGPTEGASLYPSYLTYGVLYGRRLVPGPYSLLRGTESVGNGGGYLVLSGKTLPSGG